MIKKYFLVVVSLFILILIGVFLWHKYGKSPLIKRVQFENMPDNPVFFKFKDKLVTARGVIVNNAFKERLIVLPELNGEYLMSFSILGAEGKIDGYVLHRQKKYDFKIRGPISLIEIPLKLSFSDKVEIFLNEAKNKLLLTSPSFYKMDKSNETGELIFLIVADTLRRDALGVYNPKKKTSPNIDAFARDSVVFTKAFTTAPWTLPAHVSLFSGLYAHRHGVNYGYNKIPETLKLMGELLKRKFLLYGFTGGFFVSGRYGFYRGFELYEESERDSKIRRAARELFENVKNWLEEQRTFLNRVFFLHTYQVHGIYRPEIFLAKEYCKRAKIPEFNKYVYDVMEITNNPRAIFMKVPESTIVKVRRIYDAGVYTFDYHFGRFIKYLKEKKLYKKSMIILVADHGEEIWDHKGWRHGHTLYNELINIPLIIKFPENKFAGVKNNSPVSLVDLLPTILNQFNVNSHPDYVLDGVSLINVIKAQSNKKRTIISYLSPHSIKGGVPMKISVLSGRLKFIFNQKMSERDKRFFIYPPPDIRKFELFDIDIDPGETNNIMSLWKYRKEMRWFKKFLRRIYLRKTIDFKLSLKFKKELESLGYVN